MLIGSLQLRLFDGGLESLAGLEALVTATDARRALWLLLVVAVTPAVCEELVFRGVLLQSMAREERALRSILISAAVFGAFHLSFETSLRFLPTFWLGLLMGWVVWHSRSVFASMGMHLVNNGIVVLLLWQPGVRALILRDDALSWPAVAAGAVLLLAGIRLMPRRTTPIAGAPPW
jgi:sodium transport system permease protein